jgi:putative hemolysin
MEIIVILFLVLLNGFFAMAEIAIVSSKKTKLKQMAENGNEKAKKALELAHDPNQFLSTIQVGITLIGIMAGAIGEATLAKNFAHILKPLPFIGGFSEIIALVIVVSIITYLSLIIGELVPKRLALYKPERIAVSITPMMQFIASIFSPVVSFLSASTETVMKLLGIKNYQENPVTEEEIKALIKEGARIGIFEKTEKDIVERALRLGDKKIGTLMTPKQEIVWLNIQNPKEVNRQTIIRHPHSRFPVCNGSLDKVVGIIHIKDLLTESLTENNINIQEALQKPLFFHENLKTIKALELFKQSLIHVAIVTDEYGAIQGLVTLNDVLEALVGDLSSQDDTEESYIVKRQDNSWLLDGLLPLDKFKEKFSIKNLPGEDMGYQTIGGFVMTRFDHIPKTGDNFSFDQYYFEVVDMDDKRIDKILFTTK